MARASARMVLIGVVLEEGLIAGSFAISPIRLDLGARQSTAALSLENPGPEERSYQVTAVRWDQDAQGDVYEPAPELVVVPPIFQLKPKGKQLIRIGVRQSSASERSYRIFVQELPLASAGLPADGAMAVQTLLRVSLPVFVEGLLPAGNPELRWQARAEALRVCLEVENAGSAHVHLRKVHWGERVHQLGAFYLLAGKKREVCVPVESGQAGPISSLLVETDRGDRSYDVQWRTSP